MRRQPKEESVSGKTQYPRIQTDWKKEMDPPSNCAFSVTAAAPTHTMTNTVANTSEAASPGAERLSVVERSRHTNRGPHKSPAKQ